MLDGMDVKPRLGVVVIGRNEGERLRACLESVVGRAVQVVYVDSGSTDNSVSMARAFGVDVIELDMRQPFTAARARNQGFWRLCHLAPGLSSVQFIDGDCQLAAGWLDVALDFLGCHPDVAVVFGRRRERHPERSVYNLLCDIEWDTPVGEAKFCGGDAMISVRAMESVGGYRPGLIAGEEPELCVRMRANGWHIWRLDAEMTLHDANMTRFEQWWKRNQRNGHASAEGAQLHGMSSERHRVRELCRAWAWGLALPFAVLCLAVIDLRWGLLVLAYPLQVLRLTMVGKRSLRINAWHALFLTLSKFPEAQGQLKFWWDRLRGKTAMLIEYK